MEAAVERMGLLTKKMEKFSPDLGISFCSPDASVTFGLGVKHIAFSDMCTYTNEANHTSLS